MRTLPAAKYEALGNDFLVVFADDAPMLDAGMARALCDRHRGVGADGLIRLTPDGAGLVHMELFNADGSLAETSGNGLRCAALAAYEAGLGSGADIPLVTVAGPAPARVESVGEVGAEVSVAMGEVRLARAPRFDEDAMTAWTADVGNPHLVLLAESIDGRDVGAIGARLSVAVDGGQNVELVAGAGGRLEMAVYERGVGLTLACGSGSVAAAAVARRAGLAGGRVVVDNPGGELVVALSGDAEAPRAVLFGPARRIARLEVDLPPLAGVAHRGEAAEAP